MHWLGSSYSGRLNPLPPLVWFRSSHGWACGDADTVILTTDGGSSWSPWPTGLGGSHHWRSIRCARERERFRRGDDLQGAG